MGRGDATHAMGKKKAMLDIRFKGNIGGMIREFVHSKADDNTAYCIQPSLSILCEGQPDRFYSSINSGTAADGLLNRFIIFNASRRRRGALNKKRDWFLDSSVIELFRPLAAISVKAGFDTDKAPQMQEVKMSGPARTISNKWEANIVDRLDVGADRTRYELFNRTLPQGWTLAALLAIADNPAAPLIDDEQMMWAFNTLKDERDSLLKRFKDELVGAGDSARRGKLLLGFKAFATTKSNSISTAMRRDGFITRRWLRDYVKHTKQFSDDGNRSFEKLLSDALGALVAEGILEKIEKGSQAQLDYDLRGEAYKICPA